MVYNKMGITKLMAAANAARRDSCGNSLELCSIINAKSGLCGEDCKFCAQSARHSTNVATYQLKSTNEILKAAIRAKRIGAGRFGIVTSGNVLSAKEIVKIAGAISQIKNKIGIRVCASLGALSKDALMILKDAGLERYHHNIETSPRYYKKIVSTHTFTERIKTIRAAKSAGLEVCSGGIVGMGETWQDRIEMALLLRRLGVDSIPINFLIPIKGTPLENVKTISARDAIRTIAIFRMILKDKLIRIAAGREQVLKGLQKSAFMAGANGMMIGGYLTVKGSPVEEDQGLVRDIKNMWRRY